MPFIDGIVVPDLLYTASEMAISLKIGIKFLRKLEKRGLPYYDIGNGNNPNLHRYDPIEVWEWYQKNITHKGDWV